MGTGVLSQVKQLGFDVCHYLLLAPRLSMCGVIVPSSYGPLWRGQGYFYPYIYKKISITYFK
jgi:hypothetical protein